MIATGKAKMGCRRLGPPTTFRRLWLGAIVAALCATAPFDHQATASEFERTSQEMVEGAEHFRLGRFDRAIAAWTAALRKYQVGGDLTGRIEAMTRRAEAYQALGHNSKSIKDLSKALDQAKQQGDEGVVANLQGALGNAYFMSGAPVRAQAELLASLKYARAKKDNALTARTLNNLGNVRSGLGRPDEAVQAFRASHEMAQLVGDEELAATALLNAARVSAALNAADTCSLCPWSPYRFRRFNNCPPPTSPIALR